MSGLVVKGAARAAGMGVDAGGAMGATGTEIVVTVTEGAARLRLRRGRKVPGRSIGALRRWKMRRWMRLRWGWMRMRLAKAHRGPMADAGGADVVAGGADAWEAAMRRVRRTARAR